MCCKILLFIYLEEFPDIFLFRVPTYSQKDRGDADNVVAVTNDAGVEAASLTSTASTADITDGHWRIRTLVKLFF